MDHISKTWIELDVDIDTNIQNLTGRNWMMSLCYKQHVRNILGLIY